MLDTDSTHKLFSLFNRWFLFAAFVSLTCSVMWPAVSHSDAADEFSGMAGWTILAVTRVDGEFEGCDFNKKIEFVNGMVLECSTYGYTYSYSPSAVIFVKVGEYNDLEFYMIKALIDDEMYDMAPQVKR